MSLVFRQEVHQCHLDTTLKGNFTMTDKTNENSYRIKELERQLKGLQQRVGVMTAVGNARNKSTDQRLRDLEIKTAVVQGAPQKEIARIYKLSPGRVSQIVKRIA
ncbi:hypothetical protein ACSFA3_06330 [Variovorax sp. RHLX14]|uniref:hypothetical protein n=1 Tax=Variovorax sp. RHLX14 TaxID=1259731 RepID=UPI003F464369